MRTLPLEGHVTRPGTVAADGLEESMLLAYHADRVSVNILGPHAAEAMESATRRFRIRYLLWKMPSQERRRLLWNWVPIWTGHGGLGTWVLFRKCDAPAERGCLPSQGS